MGLMRHPLEMQALRHQMNQMLETGARDGGDENGPRTWAPAVDVVENDLEIVLHAELPGLKKEEIDIQLTGDTLTIRGERKRTSTQRGENFHRIERQYGAFGRTFEIETLIDAASVSASYEDGVLTVRLPKQQEVKSRQIEIQVK
ncbi:MAG TPA: Hsp20/alpha crystallin family protein [Abditibacteriaceae bacterium]|jgi:HSP20 family protein